MVLPHLDVPHDVLAHDDRIVDEDADGQRQAEQRHRVEREAEGPHRDERGHHRHRQRQARDDGRAPGVQEQEHDEHGQRRAFEQGPLHVGHRVGDARAGVARGDQLDAGRQRLPDLVDTLADALADFGGAVAVGLDDVDADGVAPVEQRRRARLLGAVDGVGHVAQPNQLAVALGDDDAREIRGRVEPAEQADGALVERAVEPAHRRGQVLRLQRLHDLADADAGRLQRLRLERDGHLALDAADHAHLGDAGDAAQLSRQARVGDAREVAAGQRLGRQRQLDDREVVRVELA